MVTLTSNPSLFGCKVMRFWNVIGEGSKSGAV